MKATLGIFQP